MNTEGQATTTPDRDLASNLRDEGMQRALHANEGPAVLGQTLWADQVREALRALAKTRTPFLAERVFELGVPRGSNPKGLGSLVAEARRAGLIQQSGFAESELPANHRAIVRLWVGTSLAQAS